MIKFSHTPPGSTQAFLQYFNQDGQLLQVQYPHNAGVTLYRYTDDGQLKLILHGDGMVLLNYNNGLVREISQSEKDINYKHLYHHDGNLLKDTRHHYGPRTSLSNAKFTYKYDKNFRVKQVEGRIGGQVIPPENLDYSDHTGSRMTFGAFKLKRVSANISYLSDGTTDFSKQKDRYFRLMKKAVTIQKMEVFKIEFSYDSNSRIIETRTYTRNPSMNAYVSVKNYTYDNDGQLTKYDAQEPWGFVYDENGNIKSLSYRGNPLYLQYNVFDRIMKFSEGDYMYDSRGFVIQNARDEHFTYNGKGLLSRAYKKDRFDVRYFYDFRDRLYARKDNYGNITQFFYSDLEHPDLVTHIFSPRNGKLITLVYDESQHLIMAEIQRRRYYVATDQCGTPLMMFTQNGELVRDVVRSPFGHIVYDSNPYMYMPIDYAGGIYDRVTGLIHMPRGQMYDPLLGQWLTPNWKNSLMEAWDPIRLHLYRANGNDPVNLKHKEYSEPKGKSYSHQKFYIMTSILIH